MGTKRLDPEVKILQLFDGLSDEAKRIVAGLIRARMTPTAPRKTATKRKPAADPASTRAADSKKPAIESTAGRVARKLGERIGPANESLAIQRAAENREHARAAVASRVPTESEN